MAGTLLQAYLTSQLVQGVCVWKEEEIHLPSSAHSVAVVCTQSQELCHIPYLYRAISAFQDLCSGCEACIAAYRWFCWCPNLASLLLCYPFLKHQTCSEQTPHKHLHACYTALPWVQPAFSPLPSSLLNWRGGAADAAPAPQGGWLVWNRGAGSKWKF